MPSNKQSRTPDEWPHHGSVPVVCILGKYQPQRCVFPALQRPEWNPKAALKHEFTAWSSDCVGEDRGQ